MQFYLISFIEYILKRMTNYICSRGYLQWQIIKILHYFSNYYVYSS